MIRPATAADLPLLAAIEASAGELFRGTHMDFAADHPVTPVAALESALADAVLWVACDADDTPVGFLLAAAEGDYLHILELAVVRAGQRRGLGSALLAAVVAAARARGLRCVSLTTDRTLAWNAPWYAARGFAMVSGDGLPDWLRAIPAREAQAGLRPEWRCIMVQRL